MKEDKMGNIIVGIILVFIIFFALKGSWKHFLGEGGCCGSGSVSKAKKKKLRGIEVAKKRIYIEGMHCENCKNRVENSLNQIDGIAAKVDLKKNMAVVSMVRRVEEKELKQAIESIDFKVIGIETI